MTPPRALVTPDAALAASAFGLRGALIGLDLGEKTIGVAASDANRMVATPLETIARGKRAADLARLAQIARPRRAVGLVLGLPRHMNGDEGARAQSTRAFARAAAEALEMPALLWDERMSTLAVERTLLEADTSRRRRAEVVDKLAACYILQGALERLRALGRSDDDERFGEGGDER